MYFNLHYYTSLESTLLSTATPTISIHQQLFPQAWPYMVGTLLGVHTIAGRPSILLLGDPSILLLGDPSIVLLGYPP